MQISEQTMPELTPFIMDVLDNWQLNDRAIHSLLGLAGKPSSREIRKYRSGQKILAFSPELAERIDHIRGIDAALRTAYPKNGTMGGFWLRQPHRRFHQLPPIKVMLDDGLAGLMRVRVEVDCAYGWSLSEKRSGDN